MFTVHGAAYLLLILAYTVKHYYSRETGLSKNDWICFVLVITAYTILFMKV